MSLSVKVVLFKSKTLSNGEHPIMLRIIKDRKTKYINLKHNCHPDFWDEKNNLPKKKHPNYTELVVLIDQKKSEANKLVLNLDIQDKDYTADHIRKRLKRNFEFKSVFQYFDAVISRLENSNRIGSANILKSTKNSLKKFCGNDELTFTDINTSFINNYEANLLSRGVVLNSIFVYMRTFKTLLYNAKNEEIVKEEYNPFKEISFTKYRRIKTVKRAITKDNIKAIVALGFDKETSLFHSRNYFLFSFYNRGMNFVDMAFLKWGAINDNKLIYTRKKTKENFIIGLLPPALEILDFYKSNGPNSNNDYVFPILNDTHITAKSIDYRIDKVLKGFNKDLKTIAELAGIREKITSYVARHSYATIMKQSGVPTNIISESMGHDSEKTTQIYLESFGNNLLDEANKAIL